jgi:[acyl-carrier-protein] S-malonyltransferase
MPNSALLFPGQGSHFDGMDEPYREHPLFQRGLDVLGFDPFDTLDTGTREQQPAIFLCSVVAWEQRRSALDPIAAAGHSLGEYAALVAAGALQFEDALRLVDERGRAMADAAAITPGGMVAMLGGDADAVRALAGELGLVVANDNAPGQLVLAGRQDALDQAAERARDETGARARALDVAGAFHSPLMEPAAERLAAALARTPVAEPRFPVLCNSTVTPFADVRAELATNLLSPVRFRETILALGDLGAEEFVELGPGEVLTGLVRRTLVPA